jgi:Na+-translocating ferredoxin:NAD+ oxidoreductase RNF subunit RnfB
MNPVTGLPEVNDANCTACGACVKACPKDLFELRKRAKKDRKIYVACRNEDKGGPAKKSCQVACIGCSKCFKVCPFDAITMNNNLAFIDSDLCRLCRKCVPECPTNSILEIGFPPRKDKNEDSENASGEPAADGEKETISEKTNHNKEE